MVFAISWLKAARPSKGYHSVAPADCFALLYPFLDSFDEKKIVLLGAEGELGLLLFFVKTDIALDGTG